MIGTIRKLRGRLMLVGLLAFLWWWLRGRRLEQPQQPSLIEIPISPEPLISPKPPVEKAPAARTKTGPLTTPSAAESRADDLEVISGIGPKISTILQAAGIHTFAQLAQMDATQLWPILDQAGIRLAKPETWVEQAQALQHSEHAQ